MSEWRPIETAPKDGTLILLSEGTYVEPGFYDDGLDEEGVQMDDPHWIVVDQDSIGPMEPTHWMPLPEPPK